MVYNASIDIPKNINKIEIPNAIPLQPLRILITDSLNSAFFSAFCAFNSTLILSLSSFGILVKFLYSLGNLFIKETNILVAWFNVTVSPTALITSF